MQEVTTSVRERTWQGQGSSLGREDLAEGSMVRQLMTRLFVGLGSAGRLSDVPTAQDSGNW